YCRRPTAWRTSCQLKYKRTFPIVPSRKPESTRPTGWRSGRPEFLMRPSAASTYKQRRARAIAGPTSEAFDEHRHAHAARHAHRLHAVGRVERVQVVEQRRHDACAGHTEGVPERDRAAERVQLLIVDAQLLLAV